MLKCSFLIKDSDPSITFDDIINNYRRDMITFFERIIMEYTALRFKREVEFSIDDDNTLWLYLPNVAINLNREDIIGRNLEQWRDKQKYEETKGLLIKIIENKNIPESVRNQAQFHLDQVL